MNEKLTSKEKISVIVTLLLCVLAGIFLCAGVNNSVALDMEKLNTLSISLSGMDDQSHTIFETLQYNRSIHVLAMLLLGFGFLMVFVRGHGFTSLTATLLVTSIAIPVYMIVKSYVEGASVISIEEFLWAEFCAASLLIAIGAPLGRLKLNQYMLMALIFTIIYFVNEWVVLESGNFTGFQDTGGSVVIHAFGAYFGLGVVAFTDKKFESATCESDETSNRFCMVGSLVLWVFWPSFTSAVVSPERVPLTAINTVLALAGATVATYCISKLVGRGRVNIEHIANAALAGGVSIGSTCDIASPGMSLIIGILAGILSTIGYSYIAPKVCKFIRGTDTCGIHNLHGMPGLLGGLSAIVITGNVGIQLLGIIVTIAIAFIGGRITGLIIQCLGTTTTPYSDEDKFIEE